MCSSKSLFAGQDKSDAAGFNLSVVPDQVPLLGTHAVKLMGLRKEGTIRPILGEEFPFERLPEAHRLLALRRSTGRVVVKVEENQSSTTG